MASELVKSCKKVKFGIKQVDNGQISTLKG